MSNAAPHTFDSMQGMRGLGALMVVIGHAELFSLVPIGHAWIAVDMFFVLSGFVIAHAYDARFAQGLSVARFMISRWIRLVPMLIVGVAIGLVVELLGARDYPPLSLAEKATKLALQLFALHFPTAQDVAVFDLNPPLYTLEYEMLAYLAFALFWSPKNRGLYIVGGLGALALAGATLARGDSNIGADYPYAWFGFSRIAYNFCAGALVRRTWSGWQRRSVWSLLLVAAMLFVLGYQPPERFGAAFDLFGTLVFTPGLLWLCTRFETPRVFGPAFNLAGVLSYGVYAIHFPLLYLFWFLGGWRGEQKVPPAYLIGFVLFVCGFTYVLARWVDPPLRRWLAGLLLPKRAPLVPELSAAQ